ELLLELAATPEQFNCPFLYTSSRAGTATFDLQTPGTDLKPLFETILTTIPAPRADPRGPLQMLVSTLDYSSYLGRIAIGRIERGRMHVGDTVAVLPLGAPGPLGDGAYARAERGPPGGGDGRPPDVHRVGTRRAAPRRADGDDAARGI